MQLRLQITAHDFPLSEAIKVEIREKATKLDMYYNGIVRCRVVVESNKAPTSEKSSANFSGKQ